MINVQAAFLHSFMYDFRHQKSLVVPLLALLANLTTAQKRPFVEFTRLSFICNVLSCLPTVVCLSIQV